MTISIGDQQTKASSQACAKGGTSAGRSPESASINRVRAVAPGSRPYDIYRAKITTNSVQNYRKGGRKIMSVCRRHGATSQHRGFMTGEYVVNLHYYASQSKKPVEVQVKVEKVNTISSCSACTSAARWP